MVDGLSADGLSLSSGKLFPDELRLPAVVSLVTGAEDMNSPMIAVRPAGILKPRAVWMGSLMLAAGCGFTPAQEVESEKPEKIEFQVEHSRIIPLPAEGRKIVIQRVSPPVLPPPPPPAPAPVVIKDLEAARARWEERRKNPPLPMRLLSLNVVTYENGLSYLRWWMPNQKGEWRNYAAWSGTNFESLWLVDDFEVNDIHYIVFPVVMKASWRWSGGPQQPGPLYFPPDSPGYKLVEGDPADLHALNPITALHLIYRDEGPELATRWTFQQQLWAEEAEYLKNNPPIPQDTVIKMWPKRSRRHAVANEAASLAPTPVTSKK